MRLYASVRNGRLGFRPIELDEDEISVGPDEHERLATYFAEKILPGCIIEDYPGSWDGHLLCSSSVDFASEDGWPEETADEFISDCMSIAAEKIRELGRRFGPFVRFAQRRAEMKLRWEPRKKRSRSSVYRSATTAVDRRCI